jgi:hypothetical protein
MIQRQKTSTAVYVFMVMTTRDIDRILPGQPHRIDVVGAVLSVDAHSSGEARLSRAEFKALARDKGWKFTMLAQRWGVTPEWISMLCRDESRDVRYDDALLGLPDLRDAARDQARRRRRIDQAMEREGLRTASREAAGRKRIAPGLRYRGYLVAGSIVTVSATFGSMAEEGERGIVFQVRLQGREEVYGVWFENGAHDWFTPAMVDASLAATGLIAPLCTDAASGYADLDRLQADWQAGRLIFWPALPNG